MIVAPVNNVIVQIKRKYSKEMRRVAAMAALNPGSDVNPADWVNILGTVVSIPRRISDKISYKGFSLKDIQVGDSCVFRYDVVYSFGTNPNNGEFIYKNRLLSRGEEYWVCDIMKLFCVIRRNEIIMVNGYCMVEKMSVPSALILPQHLKKVIRSGEAILTHIGKNLLHLPQSDAKPGDRVYYDPRILQNYEVEGKKFGIIRQKDILGYKVGTYSDVQALNE